MNPQDIVNALISNRWYSPMRSPTGKAASDAAQGAIVDQMMPVFQSVQHAAGTGYTPGPRASTHVEDRRGQSVPWEVYLALALNKLGIPATARTPPDQTPPNIQYPQDSMLPQPQNKLQARMPQ